MLESYNPIEKRKSPEERLTEFYNSCGVAMEKARENTLEAIELLSSKNFIQLDTEDSNLKGEQEKIWIRSVSKVTEKTVLETKADTVLLETKNGRESLSKKIEEIQKKQAAQTNAFNKLAEFLIGEKIQTLQEAQERDQELYGVLLFFLEQLSEMEELKKSMEEILEEKGRAFNIDPFINIKAGPLEFGSINLLNAFKKIMNTLTRTKENTYQTTPHSVKVVDASIIEGLKPKDQVEEFRERVRNLETENPKPEFPQETSEAVIPETESPQTKVMSEELPDDLKNEEIQISNKEECEIHLPDIDGEFFRVQDLNIKEKEQITERKIVLRADECLYLKLIKVDDDSLDQIKDTPRLHFLDLTYISCDNANCAHLSKLSQLQSLDLSRSNVSDASLAHLTNLTQLKELNIYGTQVSDAGLAHITNLTQLKKLEFGNTQVSDAGIMSLNLTQLEHLGLDKTRISNSGLEYLTNLTQLQVLGLRKTSVSDEGVVHLSKLFQLQYLDLSYTSVRDEGIAYLSKLSQLQYFLLSSTSISDEGLVHFPNRSELRVLDLSYTSVSDRGLKHLSKLSQLKYLDLRETSVSDEGLLHLGNLPQLQSLYLSRTSISDEGLAHLKTLKNLQYLKFYSRFSYDKETLKLRVQSVLPDVQIDFNP